MAGKMSISGLQEKVSLTLSADKGQLLVAATGGRFILKPEASRFPALPENEHLTMRLASLVRIEVPGFGLLRLRDGSLAYDEGRVRGDSPGEHGRTGRLMLRDGRPPRQKAWRPLRASESTSWLAYSSTLPLVIPRARRVSFRGNSARRLEMNSAVPSPSVVGLVARITS